MYIDCESVYSSSSAVKHTSETLRKKLIRYLCFIPVDFIHSCHHRLKKSNFILEKNRFRSIDLLYDSQLPWTRGLEKYFGPRATAVILKSLHPFIYPRFTVMFFRILEKFIHNCPPCLLAEMAKVASSVARPRKCYINRLERFIFCFSIISELNKEFPAIWLV